jgi:dUTP pyrophosphatase
MMLDNLYLCDPVKNHSCRKTNCHNPCYHTSNPDFAWWPGLRVKLDQGAYLPQRAHDTDAGLDLRTPVDAYVRAGGSTVIDTGVHIQLPPGTVGMLKSKSGLNVKDGIVSEGVIDEGYTGTILVKLYNHGTEAKQFSRGDKITQLVVLPVLYVRVEQAEEIQGGPRGGNGYGSTGR